MALVAFLGTMGWRDAKGQTSSTRWFVGGDGPAPVDLITQDLAITVALPPLSNCAVQSVHGLVENQATKPTYGAAAEFDDVEDKAVFTFSTDSGSFHRVSVPAPKAAIFLADKETVDPANGLVATFVAAITGISTTAYTSDRNGVRITTFVGGQRIRRRTQRKYNIITKNPALSGPGL
jgi:hypothetical protein